MSDPTNLIGPKPEPVPGPKHPLPWAASTSRTGGILDANGASVLAVRAIVANKYELAELIVEAVNAYYGDPTLKDPAPLRDFVSASGTRKVFEVEPGWAVYATSREAAVERYAAQPTRRTYGTAIDASFLRDYKVVVPAPALRDFKDKDGDAWWILL